MDPSLRQVLFLDIETAGISKQFSDLSPEYQAHWEHKASFLKNDELLTADELYAKKAAIYAEFGKVIVIAVGLAFETKEKKTALRVTSFQEHNEQKLLEKFSKFLSTKFDQDKLRLCAHNGKEFDYPYLCRRMLVNDVVIPRSLDQSGKKPWEVNHLDTMDMWKFGDKKSFTSLDLLCTLFDIPSSKSDINGAQVHHVYYHEDGLDRIAAYCRRDVIATAQLYARLCRQPLIEKELIQEVSLESYE